MLHTPLHKALVLPLWQREPEAGFAPGLMSLRWQRGASQARVRHPVTLAPAKPNTAQAAWRAGYQDECTHLKMVQKL